MKLLNKKLRICLIVRYAKIAGTEKHVLLLATHLRTKYIEPHVLVLEKGDLVGKLRNEGVLVHVISNNRSVIHYLRLIVFFFRERFDIIHCHSGGYVCLAAKLAGGKRIVYTKHGIGATKEELRSRPFGRKLRDILINMCVVQYIALTKYDKYIMTRVLHINKNIIQIVHNGVDPSIAIKGETVKKRCPTIGIVGRLEKQKGIPYLIEAVPKIANKYKNLKVIIAGSGREENTLKDIAKGLKVFERINFMGYVNNPLDVIKQMDIFVLPSVWEGFPYVLLEAMFLKRPIVASNIFGINEIIQHGISGILIAPRSSEEIADAITTLLSDSVVYHRIKSAAYKRALELFTIEKTVSGIKRVYISLFHDHRIWKCITT